MASGRRSWRAGRGGSKHWRHHLEDDFEAEEFDDLYFPNYGHNSRQYFGVEDQAMRGETNGSLAEFSNVPRVDVDPNMVLLMLMGINDKLTVRKRLTTKEQPLSKIDPTPEDTAVVNYIEHERTKGNFVVPLVLRFPDMGAHGRTYRSDGTTDPNFIEMPVMIDINPRGALKVWKPDEVQKLAHPEDGKDSDIGTDASDKLAQQYGFANARDMQNSRPLQLNNHWLRMNDGRKQSLEKEVCYYQKEETKLTKKIETAREKLAGFEANIEELETGVAQDSSQQEALDEQLDTMRRAEQEAEALRPSVAEKYAALQDCTDALKAFYNDVKPEDRPKHRKQETMLRRAVYDASQTYVGCREEPASQRLATLSRRTKDAKIAGYRRTISGWQGKIEKHEERLKGVRAELERLSETEIKEHEYAPTDHTPELITLSVIAADPRSYISVMDELAEEGIGSNGRHKDIERIYRNDIYPRVLDNQSGWLRDALSENPAHHALLSSKRFFEHMHKEAVRSGEFAGDFSAYITREDSPFREHITKLSEDSISDPMLYALEDGKKVRPRGNSASMARA